MECFLLCSDKCYLLGRKPCRAWGGDFSSQVPTLVPERFFETLSTLPAADRFAPPVLTSEPKGWFWRSCQIRPGRRIVTFTHKGQGILSWAWCQVHAAILLPDANWWVHEVLLCTCMDSLMWFSGPWSILPLAILSLGHQSSYRKGERPSAHFFSFLEEVSAGRGHSAIVVKLVLVNYATAFSCRFLGQMA